MNFLKAPFGKILPFIEDPEINEIMINGISPVYIEKQGQVIKTSLCFETHDEVLNLAQNLLLQTHRRLDEACPFVDARLHNGMRLHAIIPPLSLQGPILTIRKFLPTFVNQEKLIEYKTLNQEMLLFLKTQIQEKKNILISGGTSTGKTTLLNILSSFIHKEERIITIEDVAELHLLQEHVISLESKKPNIENKGEITLRQLLQNALRMRPDRIIVGECRGEETLDMLQAMNIGHKGSLTTLHANSPRDALRRLEMLMLLSGCDFPIKALRQHIESAVDLIIHLEKTEVGVRKISHITQICGLEGDTIILHDVFSSFSEGWKNNTPMTN
ncbi:MAG: CpaF family protein [Deltaproteobacteria bacterium]|nr:CpaF family protein [Deltaproteobacteria bacterium]